MSEEFKVLKEVSSLLEKVGIPYMVTGSIAGNFYAQPRMTRDIDIVIVLDPKNIPKFVSAFEETFYVDSEMVESEVRRKGMFNLIHQKYMVKVDCVIRKDEEYRKIEFERRRLVDIQGVQFWIVSAEDLILSKLNWAKQSQSEMQLRDAENIMESLKKVDKSYLMNWAQKLGIKELLLKLVDKRDE